MPDKTPTVVLISSAGDKPALFFCVECKPNCLLKAVNKTGKVTSIGRLPKETSKNREED